MRSVLLAACIAIFPWPALTAAEKGHQRQVTVQEPTRIDWVFAVANQSPAEPPADWLPKYKSTDQKYELYVPSKYQPKNPAPLILFISPGKQPTGLAQWKSVCDEHGLLFACPYDAGNDCETRQRVRIVLDVLDDIRRRYAIAPDRTYLGGFSGGGRIACSIAFSLPEYFGGVMPVCAAGELREESWLRHRVQARLSVAHLTGENDFNRGEIERFRGPLLADVGVRNKIWTIDGLGHSIPNAAALNTAYQWLDDGVKERKKLAEDFPATRVEPTTAFDRQAHAAALLAEGKQKLAQPRSMYSGLMLLKGVLDRWPDLAAATTAKDLLLQAEQADRKDWEADDIAEQRKFLVSRARRLSDYALGPLPPQYAPQRDKMASGALQLWQLVVEDGQDAQAVADAKTIVPKLQALVDKTKP